MAESIIEINQSHQRAEMAIWDYLLRTEDRDQNGDIHAALVRRYGIDAAALVIKSGNSLARLSEQVKELSRLLEKQ